MTSKRDKELLIRVRADIQKALKDLNATGKSVEQLSRKAKKGGGGMKTFSRNTNVAAKSVSALHAVLSVGALALYVRKISQITDSYKGMQGQLKLVTDSNKELADVTESLFNIAQDTRTSWEATTQLYARVARNADVLGLSQKELLSITQITNQAIQVGGATQSEAAAGVMQFSQALSSGVLQGDEFRSVMENMPALSQAIADGLGVTTKELREMSAAGQLSAEVVTKALLSQEKAISSKYSKLPRTVGHAMTQLSNEVTMALKDTDLSPLTDSIDDFRELLSDPATISALTTFTGAIVTAFGYAASAIKEVVEFTQQVGESWAWVFNGAANPYVRLSDQIEGLQTRIRELKGEDFSLDVFLGAADTSTTEIAALEQQIKSLIATRDGLSNITKADKPATDTAAAAVDKPQKVAASALPKGESDLEKAIAKTTEALRFQALALGLTSDQAAILKLQLAGASEAQLAETRAALASLQTKEQAAEAIKVQQEAEAQLAQDKADNLQSDQELITSMEQQIELARLSGEAQIELAAIMRLSSSATDEQKERVADLAVELSKLSEKSKEPINEMDEFAKQAARNMQDAFADFLFDPFDQGLDGMARSFATTLQRMAAEALSQQILKSLFTAGAGLGGSTGAIFTALSAGVNHNGGMAGTGPTRQMPALAYAMAPKFHQGGFPGLNASEVPAVLQRGEEVLTRDDPRNALNGGADGGAGGVNIINVTDESMVADYMDSSRSDSVFINKITRNSGAIRQLLGG